MKMNKKMEDGKREVERKIPRTQKERRKEEFHIVQNQRGGQRRDT